MAGLTFFIHVVQNIVKEKIIENMIPKLLKSVFGSRNDRLLKQYRQNINAINALEKKIEVLTDDELRAKTVEFKQRVQQGGNARRNIAGSLCGRT